ncbi:MAG: rRNA maturation RNase YbeY [Anaerolineae bacterium]|jgi:probable rRNA maturation factor
MSDLAITVQRDLALPRGITVSWVKDVARLALQHEAQVTQASLTLVFTDDATIGDLNQRFRQIDGPTDVLSFPSQEGEPFVLPTSTRRHLGDVVISLETAQRQADDRQQPIDRELALLIVHGCLHLLGHDHANPADEAAMWARQDVILGRLWGEPHAQ